SARATSTDSGSSGQSGANATYPASSNSSAQLSQLEGSSHSPWMKTTGVAVVAFACSTCARSASVIVEDAVVPVIGSTLPRVLAGSTFASTCVDALRHGRLHA